MQTVERGGILRHASRFGMCLAAVLAIMTVLAGGGSAQAASCWPAAPTMDQGFPQWSSAPQMVIDPAKSYTAVVTTNRGEITIALDAEAAPATVNNFVCLASAGYYDVTVFHRIIAGFMIQGGDPTGTGGGSPGYQFADELPTGETPYRRGTIAMANAGPNTNGSQFFIVVQDQPAQFPPNYSIFGQVTSGMEVVDQIAAVPVSMSPRGEASMPNVTLGIASVEILEDGQPMVIQQSASPVAEAVTNPTPTVAATEAAATTPADEDDNSNLALWIAGGAALAAAAGYAVWRGRKRTTAPRARATTARPTTTRPAANRPAKPKR